MEEAFQDLERIFTLDNCLALLLLREGEKPGVLVMSANQGQKEKIEEISETRGWSWRVYGGSLERESFIESLKKFLGFSTNDPFDTAGIFVARSEERFQILEESSGGFYEVSEEAVGEFLGYDRDAVEFYTDLDEGETATEPYEERVDEMLESGELDEEDLKFLELVFYVPVPEKVKILEAVELGRTRWELLSSTDEGTEYLEELKQQL